MPSDYSFLGISKSHLLPSLSLPPAFLSFSSMFESLPFMPAAPKNFPSKMPVTSPPSSLSSTADSPPKSGSTLDTTPNSCPQSVFSARPFGSVPEFTTFVLKTLDNWRQSARFDLPFVPEYTFLDVSRDWAEAIFNADQSYMR